MSFATKRSWQGNVCIFWWRAQPFLWGVLVAGVGINLGSAWLITKLWDISGTPLGWLLDHPIVSGVGSALLILQAIGAFWVYQHRGSSGPSSVALLLQQREQAVLRTCGDIEQAQPGPAYPSVATLLHALQDRYSTQDIVDTLEYLEEQGDIKIFLTFGGVEASSFQLTPQGKRARALLVGI